MGSPTTYDDPPTTTPLPSETPLPTDAPVVTDAPPVATITISKADYDRLLERSEWLSYLEAAGVDNWQGIDVAFDLRRGNSV